MLLGARGCATADLPLLPPGARWVEYLESTGTQWIDTGVKVYDDTNVEITVKVNTQSEVAFIGSATSTDRFVIRSYSGSLSYGFGSWWANTAATLYNQWRTLRTDVSMPTVYCDGTSYPTTNTPSAKSGTDSILIFDSFRANRGDVAVAGVKIWRGSTLAFDAIPVRKGMVGYMYDRVTGALFGNAGTGDFVIGPDVVPVEYIESTGTQWIDTGYVPTATFAFELTYSLASVGTSNNFVFGFGGGGNGVFANLRSSATFAYGSVSQSIALSTLGLDDTNFHTIRGAGGKFYFDGVLGFTGDTAFISSRTFLLFARNGSTMVYGSIRICGCKIYDADDVLVRSFLPVRVGAGSSWEGAMMDTLTRRIYRNQGTGAFVYGADV